MSSVTTVVGKGDSLSSLKGCARPRLATNGPRREASRSPSSRSNRQYLVCRAISTRSSRLASLAITGRTLLSSASSFARSSASS